MPLTACHGLPPFSCAVIHGGPGAAGELTPVARHLAKKAGILEPMQTEFTVEGQVAELRTQLETHATLPAVLVGYSWGAWLAFIFAAQHPALVKKLILVSSGPFQEKYLACMEAVRWQRATVEQKAELQELTAKLAQPDQRDQAAVFNRFGEIMGRLDAFDPLTNLPEEIDFQPDIYRRIWPQAQTLRRSNQLLEFGRQITCPVVAIHGAHDPHPAAGVQEPLAETVADFRFFLLQQCGHKPWMEKQACDEFYRVLEHEIQL